MIRVAARWAISLRVSGISPAGAVGVLGQRGHGEVCRIPGRPALDCFARLGQGRSFSTARRDCMTHDGAAGYPETTRI